MDEASESPIDRLWAEYSEAFVDFDDLTLARWLAQTLGQLEGKSWRNSHPVVRAYQLAASMAHDRQIWGQRLATVPFSFGQAECCRAPLFPVLTRDVVHDGLVCMHCGGTAIAFDAIPEPYRSKVKNWATDYEPTHEVAHWEDDRRIIGGDYEKAFEDAAESAERLLAYAGSTLAPQLLEFYPALVWEDHDECLEVRPEDVQLSF